MKDREIIRRIKQGEKELFEDLVAAYYQDVYHFCFYRTGDAQTAYDCTQETFLHVIRFLDSYEERSHFRAWVFGIARNVCNDFFRDRREVAVEEHLLESETVAEEGFGRAELKDAVMSALDELPRIQREVIILRFYGGFKLREIAGIVGVGIPTAKSRLKQGMEKMRRHLEKEGGM